MLKEIFPSFASVGLGRVVPRRLLITFDNTDHEALGVGRSFFGVGRSFFRDRRLFLAVPVIGVVESREPVSHLVMYLHTRTHYLCPTGRSALPKYRPNKLISSSTAPCSLIAPTV